MDKIAEQISNAFNTLSEQIYGYIDSIVLSIPNLLLVLLTLFIGAKLIKWSKKLLRRIAVKSFQVVGVQNLFMNVTVVFLWLVLFLAILAILGLDGTVKTILASAGVAGLALGLALQDPLMNLFSGIIMSVKHDFNVGDFIESNNFIGEVKEVSLKSTVLRMLSGEEVNIPNKLVLQNPVKNFTTNGLRRIEVNCGVSYADDLEKVMSIAIEAVKDLAIDSVPRPVEFIYTNFGESSIDFQLRFWISSSSIYEYLDLKSQAIMRVKKAFDQSGITIPFPIRTLDFGIKGGQAIGEAISFGNK
jgi:small conductance mechanosensitive channel